MFDVNQLAFNLAFAKLVAYQDYQTAQYDALSVLEIDEMDHIHPALHYPKALHAQYWFWELQKRVDKDTNRCSMWRRDVRSCMGMQQCLTYFFSAANPFGDAEFDRKDLIPGNVQSLLVIEEEESRCSLNGGSVLLSRSHRRKMSVSVNWTAFAAFSLWLFDPKTPKHPENGEEAYRDHCRSLVDRLTPFSELSALQYENIVLCDVE